MKSWRITKYNPKNRDEDGSYLKDEWTSCYDIGKSYDDKEFTVNDYITIENLYIDAILSFMKEINVQALTVKYLEKYNDSIRTNEIPLMYTEEMIRLFKSVHEGSAIGIEDVQHLCRLVLREQLWCKLETNKMFVHFGYDFYMYIGCMYNCENIISFIKSTGLFIEEFKSPYKEE